MYNWQSMLGKFEYKDTNVKFLGGVTTFENVPDALIGNLICNQRFSGGVMEGVIKFSKIGIQSACQFIVSYQPATNAFVTAGIGNDSMFVVRSFFGNWKYHATGGDRINLSSDREYHVKVYVVGSRLILTVDGVDVLDINLPFPLPNNQVGIWCQDVNEIEIKNFKVAAEPSRAFIVMQFTKPYNELYAEVIQPICKDFGIEAIRADETYGPGLIVSDISRQISEANLIVAEITPANPNVYYEVGYAHALNKPTILIAEKETQLPFDVSPFRTLFYENSIEGKRRVEEGFRKHLKAISATLV